MRRPLKQLLCLLFGVFLAGVLSRGSALSSMPVLAAAPVLSAKSTSSSLVALDSTAPDSTTPDSITQNLTASALIEQGRAAYNSQRFTDAVAAWSQVVSVQRPPESASSAQLAPLDQALTLSYLSAAYQQLGQWESARSALSQSQSLLPARLDSVKAQQVSAQVHNALGGLHFALGETQQALEIWQVAADLYAKTDADSRYFNNLLNQIQAQQTLGYYHQVRRTIDRLEQRLSTQSAVVQIQGYQRLGQAYRLTGDLTKAQASLQTALDLAQTAAYPTAPILLERGNIAQAEGDTSTALEFYQQAIASSQSSSPGTHPDIQVKAQLNQLKLLAETEPTAVSPIVASLSLDIPKMTPGRSQIYAYIHASQSLFKPSLFQRESAAEITTGVRWLAQAIQQSIELQDSRAESYAKGALGHAYELSQQWADAQAMTEEALRIAQAINASDIVYQWQWQLGRLLKQQGQRDLALQTYREAFSTLQLLRQDIVTTSQDLQFSFRDSVEPVYRELVDLLLQPTSEQLVGADPYPQTKSEQIESEQRQLEQTAIRQTKSQLANPEQRQARLVEARKVIESLQVAELDNFFRTACLEAQQVDLDQVEQTSAAIIYPIILPDRLEMIVSLPNQPLQQYTTPVAQAKLEQTLISWRQNIEKPFTAPEGKALGQEIYSWLIEPMQTALIEADIKTLTFVLDGALRNVPMAALYDGERYLIEQYAVALSPGLQLLGPRSLQETNETALLAGLTESRHGFSPLLNVADELETVQTLVDSNLLLNESFTTEQLTQQVTQTERPIIHLATHGQFSSNAEDTFILAWDRPIPVHELSALLRAGDDSRVEPIELLVLSACETANGDNRAALGLAGVALQSGTRSTLASLWNLDDASGAVFVQAFYRAIAPANITKADALRSAQLTLLKDPNYRHPIYWAAYVLVGNWL
ncbi:CHAT domain-containing protein [cf. Phormidesmis sp. LEGE 11477]|uniref:CHAT domain-containing protein n=1 Tax=cf. Phormidesmis sp. LEGE 11477 TaxID=1828680 RepID=UPI00188013E4|nr:CHAT domain-containing protein [cf. Phormidesmis sp. LEGE 11477]MBE9064621.1 CHAT domain-containing protein [cf. Phormidesmis sp. LEGE 11477]